MRDDPIFARRRAPTPPVEVPAVPGTVVEHRLSGFSGEIVDVEAGSVILRDWREHERSFLLRPGAFLVEDRPATLVPAARAATRGHPAGCGRSPRTTASGAVVDPSAAAKVAQPHRIYVEGTHDAELLEKVWGDELRDAAVVVEPLGGADDLAEAVGRFGPGPERRLGILLDHLVPGSKESRIAAGARHPHVLITGHPYVDVWQGVRPSAVGIESWPTVPRGTDWKTGICAALGEPEPAVLWRRLLRSVNSFADLEPELVGAVERLLDFLIEVPDD